TAPLAPPSSARRVPADLEAICRKALTRSPRRRYRSAAELADDLRRAQLGQPVSARPRSGMQRLGAWMRRRPGTVVLLLLLLTSCVFGLIAYGSGESEADDLRNQLNYANDRLRQAELEGRRSRASSVRTAKLQELLSYKQTIDRAAAILERDKEADARNTA